MASVVRKEMANGVRYSIQLSPGENEARPRLSLGKVTKKQAETAKRYIEKLINSKNGDGVITPVVQEWLNGITDGLRKRLKVLGIIETKRGQSFTVSEWVRRYIDRRPDVKQTTKRKWKDVERKLTAFFRGQFIDDVTVQQAKDFRVYLKSVTGLAENSIRRQIGIVRQFFNSAIDAGLIKDNPFRGQSVSLRPNPARFYYITQEIASQVLEVCPDVQWRLIFGSDKVGRLTLSQRSPTAEMAGCGF